MRRGSGTKHSHVLEQYRQAIGTRSSDVDATCRAEIDLVVNPGDQVTCVQVRLPVMTYGAGEKVDLVRLSSTLGDRLVEVTRLRASRDDMVLAIACVGRTLMISATAATEVGPTAVTLDFLVWDTVSPMQGAEPYLHSTLDLMIDLCAPVCATTLLCIDCPADAGPRSTQGNYRTAFPSTTLADRRLTRLYFPGAELRLRYRLATNDRLTSPWLALGRAAVSALFAFIVVQIATQVEVKDRFFALLVALVAVAGAGWELVRDTTQFTIYDAWRRRIPLLVLAAQGVLLASMLLAVLSLAGVESLLRPAAIASAGVGTLLAVVAVVGFSLHSIGWWHGFACDQAGCSKLLRRRRRRAECRYTGRVLCDDHVATLCSHCLHWPDLRRGELITSDLFGTVNTPCGAVRDVAPVTP